MACAALPASAMGTCAMVAFLMRQLWKQIKTICIEVAVQNSAVPLLILGTSFEQPDLSSVPSILVAIAVGVYLGLAWVIHLINNKCCKQSSKPDNNTIDMLDTSTVIENNNNTKTSLETVSTQTNKAHGKGFVEPETIQLHLLCTLMYIISTHH